VEVNKVTEEVEFICSRDAPDASPVAAVGGVAEQVQTERRVRKKKKVRKANREIFERGQQKPESSRIKFSDAERADPAMSKVIRKSDKAADRYETARAKIPKEKVLSIERVQKKSDSKTQSQNPATKGKTTTRLVFKEREKPPNSRLTHALERPGREAVALFRGEAKKSGGDNTGVQAADFSISAAGVSARKAGDIHSKLRFEPQRQLQKAEEKAMKANVNAIYKRDLRAKPELQNANTLKKAAHKRKIKKDYARAFRQGGNIKDVKQKAERAKEAAKKIIEAIKKVILFVVRNWKIFLIIGIAALIIIILISLFSACMSMFGGGFNAIIATSYTAEDADILSVDEDYTNLENDLAARIANIPNDYPDFDEYNYNLDAIGHDPFELASYLTSRYYAYTRAAVQGDLPVILSQQYRLTLTPVTEIRYRTEYETEIITQTDPDTGEEYEEEIITEVQVPYEYYILNVSLENFTIDSVALTNLIPDQYEMYLVLMETKGNKPELFP
jgi:hypothetical protein